MSEATRRPPASPGGSPAPRFLFVYVALALGLLWMWQETFQRLAYQPIAYSAFKQALAAGEVKRAAVAEQHIEGELLRARPEGGEETVLFRTSRVEDPKLTEELLAAKVEVMGVHPSFLSQLLWAWLLPLALIFGLWIFLSRRFAAAGAQALSFGKSRARLVADADTGVDFSDVEGCREAKAELVEVVDYLKSPERYRALGAKIPKGVLLLGPPGTGKTLLARAVAGEAGVPFYSISGSDFVEMFVGVGAARVRDLFAQAKAQAPCIVFIDEIDAIGRQRGVQMGMVNDEREQTLNQLLVELDGFDANSGVIVLAATNRPEVLDRALLRPGRFDRQVLVDAPDRDGREAILRLHVANKPLAAGVDLARVARATPGFSGADLANVANEAALIAARERSPEITQRHLEESVEKVVAGPERKSRRLSEADRRRVAFHEVGHALVAARSEGADPVHKISIVPRGRGALGYTMQLPEEDRFLLSRSALESRIRTLLGGRAAEELVLGDVSTGAQDDLARATALARQMITVYGMGESAGLANCAQPANGAFVAAPGGFVRDCSEATAREIDLEVKALLKHEYSEARGILAAERGALERIAGELLRHESLDGTRFGELLRQPLAA
jgi:cell division protease FtsH